MQYCVALNFSDYISGEGGVYNNAAFLSVNGSLIYIDDLLEEMLRASDLSKVLTVSPTWALNHGHFALNGKGNTFLYADEILFDVPKWRSEETRKYLENEFTKTIRVKLNLSLLTGLNKIK